VAVSVSEDFSGRDAERRAKVGKVSGLRGSQPNSWGNEISGFSGILALEESKGLEYLTEKKIKWVLKILGSSNPELHKDKLRM
jgi:hypothetical protein